MTGGATEGAAGETTGPGVAAVGAASAETGNGGWLVEYAWGAGVFLLSQPPAKQSPPIAMVETAVTFNNAFIRLVLIFRPLLLLILASEFLSLSDNLAISCDKSRCALTFQIQITQLVDGCPCGHHPPRR